MNKPLITMMLFVVAVGWACAMHMLTGGASSLSHLPTTDGSSVSIHHVRVKSNKSAADAILSFQVRDDAREVIRDIAAENVDFFVGSKQVEPTWWNAPDDSPLSLTICVPSRVGVASDRTGEGIRDTVRGAIDELDEDQDTVGLIIYGQKSRVVQKQTKPTNQVIRDIAAKMKSAKSSSTSRVSDALKQAQSMSGKAELKQSRSIFIVAEAADSEIVTKLDAIARKCRVTGVTVHLFGVGKTVSGDEALSQLAAFCGGSYAHASSTRELQRLIRRRVRKLKSEFHVGLKLDEGLSKDESLLIQARIRTPSGIMEDAVFYSDVTNPDWLVDAVPVEDSHEALPLANVELYFTLGTLGVLLISLAIPFVKLGRRERKKKTPAEPVTKEEIPPDREDRPQPISDESRKEVDRPLPSPPAAGSGSSTPSRPPPMRRGKDLR